MGHLYSTDSIKNRTEVGRRYEGQERCIESFGGEKLRD
jgi:hypothetical protein